MYKQMVLQHRSGIVVLLPVEMLLHNEGHFNAKTKQYMYDRGGGIMHAEVVVCVFYQPIMMGNICAHYDGN